MKVYVFYGEGEKQFRLKVNIPPQWLQSSCKLLLEHLLQNLPASLQEPEISADTLEIKCGNLTLHSTDIIGTHIHEYNDLFVNRKPQVEKECNEAGLLRCTNYGCGKLFSPEKNTETSCHYHSKGPIFHDLEKHWGCCPSRKGYDWEEFQNLPTCQTGAHSTENKPFVYPREEVLNVPIPSNTVPSSDRFETKAKQTSGPREFEEAIIPAEPQKIIDGKARCRNFGCFKEFIVEENNNTACVFHKRGPVIWDTYKYWNCCPEKKCYEMDDFLKVPGCSRGPHKL